jgi:hypothetical protein
MLKVKRPRYAVMGDLQPIIYVVAWHVVALALLWST